jgi:hypothetical protein
LDTLIEQKKAKKKNGKEKTAKGKRKTAKKKPTKGKQKTATPSQSTTEGDPYANLLLSLSPHLYLTLPRSLYVDG